MVRSGACSRPARGSAWAVSRVCVSTFISYIRVFFYVTFCLCFAACRLPRGRRETALETARADRRVSVSGVLFSALLILCLHVYISSHLRAWLDDSPSRPGATAMCQLKEQPRVRFTGGVELRPEHAPQSRATERPTARLAPAVQPTTACATHTRPPTPSVSLSLRSPGNTYPLTRPIPPAATCPRCFPGLSRSSHLRSRHTPPRTVRTRRGTRAKRQRRLRRRRRCARAAAAGEVWW